MKLTSLEINLQPSYAENAGKYIATLQYEEGRQNAIKILLDPEISMKLLAFVGPAITAAAAAAARQIEANIIGSLEAAKPTLEISATHDELKAIAEGVLTCLSYPRGSEAQIRCLEEVGIDARVLIEKEPKP
jgi:hypothetical protein